MIWQGCGSPGGKVLSTIIYKQESHIYVKHCKN